jgi:hypothetical protein
MNNIPEQFKQFANSVELYDQCEALGEKFGLHIDQVGELDAEIRDILTGASESKDFTQHIVERLEITPKLANDIAQEVTKSIFGALRANLQPQTSNTVAPDISSLERVGGFSVERESPESANGVTSADRTKILAGLENPPSSIAHTGNPPTNLPTDGASARMPSAATTSTSTESHSEPLVDYLLSNPAGRAAQNIPVTPPTPVAPKKPAPPVTSQVPKNDPYKEAI